MKYLKCDVERLSYAAPIVRYASVCEDEIGRWSQTRVSSFVSKILMESNNLKAVCGSIGDTLICGPIIGTILCSAYPVYTPMKEDGQIGILKGGIKVYLVDEDAIDPETLLIGHITDTNSTTRLIKWEGLKNCIRQKLPFEVFNE